ncbi:MAG: hypothetical protein ACEQSK_19685 [Sphingomonadaceae bacterium]
MSNPLLDYRPELEFLAADGRGVPDDVPEHSTTLSAALLDARSEAQLQQILAHLVDQARAASGQLLAATQYHPLKQALVSGLQRAAHRALPLGSVPLAGPMIEALGRSGASALKQRAARVFGLELEGLSPEDKEFELVQRFVQFADAAARHAITHAARSRAGAPAAPLVPAALMAAAQQYAPGLLRPALPASGNWQRQGQRITLFDC